MGRLVRDELPKRHLRVEVNLAGLQNLEAEHERYYGALVQIAGHFVPGHRNTYAPAAETLDMIRREAEDALSLGGCPCVGTPDEEGCPHA